MAPRTPFDTYAKDLAHALLSPLGIAERDARIETEPQLADLRFVLDLGAASAGGGDFLTSLLAPQTLLEFAHNPPGLATMVSWTQKRDAWWRLLRNEATRTQTPLPKLPPMLLGLSAGDPIEARTLAWMRPMVGFPGCFEGPPAGTFRLVVISALPRTRETLLVRTMGAGATLREALQELEALPFSAPERLLAGRMILRLRVALKADTTDESRQYRMDTDKIVDAMLQQQLDRGIEKGIEKGIEQGIERGVAPLRRLCARRLGRALSPEEHSTLRARLDLVGPDRLGDVILDSDAAALAAWLADPDGR